MKKSSRRFLNAPFEINKPQRVLMCYPQYFAVEYEINRHMKESRALVVGKKDPVNKENAYSQWYTLVDSLLHADVKVSFIKPVGGLPDFVFTANAGFVYGGKIVLSNFRHQERAPEQIYFHQYFDSETDLEPVMIPLWGLCGKDNHSSEFFFEGHGDALFFNDFLFCASGERSNEGGIKEAIRISGFKGEYSILQLVNSYFYHLDTCLCPVGDAVLYYPDAFSQESQEEIRRIVDEKKGALISVSQKDAMNFVCNGIPVKVGKHWRIITSQPSPLLCDILHEAQIDLSVVDVSEFVKAGGGARCLVLFF